MHKFHCDNYCIGSVPDHLPYTIFAVKDKPWKYYPWIVYVLLYYTRAFADNFCSMQIDFTKLSNPVPTPQVHSRGKCSDPQWQYSGQKNYTYLSCYEKQSPRDIPDSLYCRWALPIFRTFHGFIYMLLSSWTKHINHTVGDNTSQPPNLSPCAYTHLHGHQFLVCQITAIKNSWLWHIKLASLLSVMI